MAGPGRDASRSPRGADWPSLPQLRPARAGVRAASHTPGEGCRAVDTADPAWPSARRPPRAPGHRVRGGLRHRLSCRNRPGLSVGRCGVGHS